MGQIVPDIAHQLVIEGHISSIRLEPGNKSTYYESYTHTKVQHWPVLRTCDGHWAQMLRDKVHSNLWGLAPVETLGGQRYFATFMDNCMWEVFISLLHHKSETFGVYKKYKAYLMTQYSRHIKALHCNHEGEYLGTEFSQHLGNYRFIYQLSVHNTSQQNRVMECLNGVLAVKMCTMLYSTDLPLYL